MDLAGLDRRLPERGNNGLQSLRGFGESASGGQKAQGPWMASLAVSGTASYPVRRAQEASRSPAGRCWCFGVPLFIGALQGLGRALSAVQGKRWRYGEAQRERRNKDSLRGAKASQKSRSERVPVGANGSLQPEGCEGGLMAVLRGSKVEQGETCRAGHLRTKQTDIGQGCP